MEMCSTCSLTKIAGEPYDKLKTFAANGPNCASNFCRSFYFSNHDPTKADIALRWAASVLIKIKEEIPKWGESVWMEETIEALRTHHAGIGKFVSHYGTTRMNFRNSANIMFQGQGKQITVDRQQQLDGRGVVHDFYQFSYDHGNRFYADYMQLLFPIETLRQLTGSECPKEEALGDCVEMC